MSWRTLSITIGTIVILFCCAFLGFVCITLNCGWVKYIDYMHGKKKVCYRGFSPKKKLLFLHFHLMLLARTRILKSMTVLSKVVLKMSQSLNKISEALTKILESLTNISEALTKNIVKQSKIFNVLTKNIEALTKIFINKQHSFTSNFPYFNTATLFLDPPLV